MQKMISGRILFFVVVFATLQQTLCTKNVNDFVNPFLEQSSIIDDCCCSITSVVEGNNDLNPLLNTIVSKRFFQYFKLDLFSECPFWVTDLVCGSGGCAVCECDEDEVPQFWEREKPTDLVERLKPPSWGWLDTLEDMWTVQGKEEDMAYVNLARYPESHTAYNGKIIWDTIYKENCFSEPLESMCLEQRVFYRLISGLHTSINLHIARYYEKNADGDWDCNLDFFQHRILNHPDRIKNLYFVFLFLVRAANKAAPILEEYDYDTGNPQESAEVRQLIKEFLNTKLLCSPNFDESMLFSDPQKETLKQQFKQVFRKISMLLNCVTCEKCKVYSKLQTLGVGTALKILFDPSQNVISQLQRNEIIALINTLRQFSNSVKAVEYMSALLEKETQPTKETKAQQPRQATTEKRAKKEKENEMGFSKAFIGGVMVLAALTWIFLKPYNEEEAERINRALRREQGYTQEDDEWEQEEQIKQEVQEKSQGKQKSQ
mmetsp:Transcript_10632/g.14563  ORF Transcript_10632/g.14563 Transcript_10632/m.14563 type:complete len:489 (+) Transcript_10632:32-1498(+)